ncbi:MAG: PEP-CTERM sorting domain-containing protein [Pirellula sp.]
MKRLLATTLLAMGLIAFPTIARGEIVLNTLGTYSQNFDGLGTANVNGVFSATIGTIAAIPNLTGEWDGAKVAGTGTTATNFVANDGSSSTGSIFNYGTTGNSDRALGMLASGANAMGVGFVLRNNTGVVIDSLTIQFTQENWRSSTTAVNTMTFGLGDSTMATGANYLTAASFESITALNLVGPDPVASNGPLNGNDPLNQVSRSATINTFKGSALLFNPGDVLYFRWQDANDGGNDAGLAIDNFSLTAFSSVPEPTSLALVGVALGAGSWLRLRRRVSR